MPEGIVPIKNAFKKGILLVNLGTPDSPSVPDVRKYLRQFLTDARVIDIPPVQRWALVNAIIAPFRAPRSAALYKKVWMAEGGSPLKHYGLQLERLVQAQLGEGYLVRLAMRYQNPSIESVLLEMKAAALEDITILPLFPQYASASTGSVAEEVMRVLASWQVVPTYRIINRFFDDAGFIEAFAQVARPRLAAGGFDHLLFSYHGLPERQITKGDDAGVCRFGACCDAYTAQNQYCYRAQCFATTRLLLQALDWPAEKATTAFQSRLGRTPWIKPYSDLVIKDLAAQGVKRLAVMSPSFIADCLETVLEIGEEYRELFEKSGGDYLELIPSLNAEPAWVETVQKLVVGEMRN